MLSRRRLFSSLFQTQVTRIAWDQAGGKPGDGPSRLYLAAGPKPQDTTYRSPGGGPPQAYDAVMWLDSADSKLKVLRADGTIVVLG